MIDFDLPAVLSAANTVHAYLGGLDAVGWTTFATQALASCFGLALFVRHSCRAARRGVKALTVLLGASWRAVTPKDSSLVSAILEQIDHPDAIWDNCARELVTQKMNVKVVYDNDIRRDVLSALDAGSRSLLADLTVPEKVKVLAATKKAASRYDARDAASRRDAALAILVSGYQPTVTQALRKIMDVKKKA